MGYLYFDCFPSSKDDLRIKRKFVQVMDPVSTVVVSFGPFQKAKHREIHKMILDAFQRRQEIVTPTDRHLFVHLFDFFRAYPDLTVRIETCNCFGN